LGIAWALQTQEIILRRVEKPGSDDRIELEPLVIAASSTQTQMLGERSGNTGEVASIKQSP